MDPTSELSQFYSSRLDHFQSQLISLVHRITQDELLSQFTQNPLSQEFYFDRIKEIIEESLNLEQESSIETLMKSNVFLKTEIKRIEDELSMKNEEISDFKQRFMRLEGENEKERKNIKILRRKFIFLKDFFFVYFNYSKYKISSFLLEIFLKTLFIFA